MPSAFSSATPAYLISALGWGLVLVLSFVGWGGALVRIVARGRELDAGLRGALGLALTVAVGGVANLFSWISRPAVLLWVAGGVWGFVVDLLGKKRKETRPAHAEALAGWARFLGLVVLVLVAVFSAVLFAGSVDGKIFTGSEYRDFDPHDDEQSYLVFPRKMLEIGGLGADPFDARRLIVLGGQSLLQATVAVLFPPRTTHLLDAGAGLLLSLAVVWGAARRAGLSRGAAALPLLLLLLLPSAAARGNTTALFTGVALLAGAFRLVEEEPFAGAPRLLRAVPAGLVIAALVAIKTTFLPAVVLFLGFDALLAVATGRGTARLLDGLTAGLLGALFLLPWMISVKLSSGTFLFPLLGRGFQGTIPWTRIPGIPAEALAPVAGRALLLAKSLAPFASAGALGVLAWIARRRTAPVALGLATLVLPAVLRFAGDPYLDRSLWRYGFPAFAAALPLLLAACLSQEGDGRGTPGRLAAAGALLAAAAVVANDAPLTLGGYRQAVSDVASGVSGRPLVDADLAARSASLLAGVPAGAAVLTRMPHPVYLDPAAHRLLLFPIPGFSSPPPGMPYFRGAEPVARYLLEQGVRYLAYGDRGDGSNLLLLSDADIRYRYPLSKSRWALRAYNRDFHRNAAELSLTRRRLADQPDAFVLDLGERALRLPVTEAPQHLTGITPDGWTMGRASIRLDYDRGEKDRFLRIAFSGALPPSASPAGRALRVVLDEVELPVVRREPLAIVCDLSAAPERLEMLYLRSPASDPSTFGGASAPPIAADLLGVATVAAVDEAVGFGPEPQRVSGPLEPRECAWRSGFTPDGWTIGDGLLANLLWEPKPGDAELAVELAAVPPGPPDRPDLHVLVNGVPLPRIGVGNGVWRFRLLPDQPAIRRIRLLSKTWVPKEEGVNDDGRRLGVVVARIRLSPAS
ncbi:MAG: hypothetical protein ACM3JH_04320 [Acidithiobacillales bacterium]